MKKTLFISLGTLGLGISACGGTVGTTEPAAATSTAPAAQPKGEDLVIAGKLSLETGIDAAHVFIFTVTEKASTAALAVDVVSAADGTYTATIRSGTLAIDASRPLITMSKKALADGSGDDVLWSYVLPSASRVTSNLNSLTSIAYEVAVLEQDLAASASVAARVATVFGTPAAIETLDPADVKITRLGRVVELVATRLRLKVGALHKTIAADVRDGALDGVASGAPAEIIDRTGVYPHVVEALKALVAGEEPGFETLASHLPPG